MGSDGTGRRDFGRLDGVLVSSIGTSTKSHNSAAPFASAGGSSQLLTLAANNPSASVQLITADSIRTNDSRSIDPPPPALMSSTVSEPGLLFSVELKEYPHAAAQVWFAHTMSVAEDRDARGPTQCGFGEYPVATWESTF